MQALCGSSSKGEQQLAFYHRGVGTSDADRFLGGAFGSGFDSIVRDAYINLSEKWSEGDEIYLFGFSRGAYIARILANIICAYGLISRWQLRGCANRGLPVRDESDAKAEAKASLLSKKSATPIPPWLVTALAKPYVEIIDNITIKCVGVWDTVDSLGPLNSPHAKKYYSATIPAGVDYVFHA
jgi:Uncharacterized alpha/beta hydrolase domain (DUF2235)